MKTLLLIFSLMPSYGKPAQTENPFEAEPIKAQWEVTVDKTYILTYWGKSNCFNVEVR